MSVLVFAIKKGNMSTYELIFENDSRLITKSRKRWPEKSARRAVALVRGSFDFS